MRMSAKTEPSYPSIVKTYRQRYDKMASVECRQQLADYAERVLHDSIEGLDWKQLLGWEHRHLHYTKGRLPKPRAELPIDIIHQAKGRCGEFALLYNGLLRTNGYQTRIVTDCSILRDKSKTAAGDHVWVEVLIDGAWVHVDPTEKRINKRLMYVNEWNKDVNLIYAFSEKEVADVTKDYKMQE
jgi:hypothetical protein